jgi:hypothetical protein
MKFLFELLKNETDNKDMIQALNNSINYCDRKTLNALRHNKHRLFQNSNLEVFIGYNGWSHNKYSNFSKNKGPLLKLRLQSIREFAYHKNSNTLKKYNYNNAMYVKEASYCSTGLYRLYKKQIYKLCNKT